MFQCHHDPLQRQAARVVGNGSQSVKIAYLGLAAAPMQMAKRSRLIRKGFSRDPVHEYSRKILVIGYGEMGHAMEFLLGGRHELGFHDIRPMDGHVPVELEAAAAQADYVIYCVPVTPLAGLAERVAPALNDRCISLTVAKGLDNRGRSAAQIFHDVYAGRHDYAVLYGPMISEEIRAGRAAFAQVGVSRAGVYARITALFAATGLALEYSADIHGISWSSVLKNVYALLFGAADELGLGDNVRGYLAVAVQAEMERIVVQMGGRETSARQLAGLGDLITTATSAGSHHHELGRLLARDEPEALRGEGIHTLAMVRKFNLVDTGAYPLFRLVQEMLEDPGSVEDRMRTLLRQAGNSTNIEP
jgi:glycerol-3-phosphate dehydrogenase (NAD(P)+)